MTAHVGDDLDNVLRAFFRAELPAPWPEPTVPDEAPIVKSRGWLGMNRSRLALAASIGLLLIGSLGMAGALKPGVPDAPVPSLGEGAKKKAPKASETPPLPPRRD